MRFTWTNVTERGILVSDFSMTRNSLLELYTLDRLRHVSALPENRLRRRHVLKDAFQLSCTRTTHTTGQWFDSWWRSRFTTGCPVLSWFLSRFATDCVRSIWQLILFQHDYCSFVIIIFGSFCRVSSVWGHFFPKRQPLLGLVKQAFWSVSLFTKWVVARSSKVILVRSSRHSTTRAFTSGTSGPRWFSLILSHERIRKRIRLCHFSTLIKNVTETIIVSFGTLLVCFPLSTISKNSLYTLFCPLILDHDVLLKISTSAPKIISNLLLDTSFHRSFQSVTIRF